MKKNIFLILVTALFILVLFYLYDAKEKIVNKEYRDYKNNITVDYPYFNNIVIDNYLNDYLETYINQSNDLLDLLFIDYDYEEINNRIELMLYIYQEKGHIIKKETRKIDIDTNNNMILENKKIIDTYSQNNNLSIKNNTNTTKLIALTFDDGPNHNTSNILDILEKYNIKATFFILGTNIKGYEKTIKRMYDLNMEIASHMYSHKLLTKLDSDTIKEEIEKVDNLIFDIINEYPTLIRPSYGTVTNQLKKIINRPIILWNIDPLDWKNHNSKKIAQKVIKNANDGDIILMHDIYRATSNSLEIIIPDLLNKGYKFTTVSELLYFKKIIPIPGKVYTNVP